MLVLSQSKGEAFSLWEKRFEPRALHFKFFVSSSPKIGKRHSSWFNTSPSSRKRFPPVFHWQNQLHYVVTFNGFHSLSLGQIVYFSTDKSVFPTMLFNTKGNVLPLLCIGNSYLPALHPFHELLSKLDNIYKTGLVISGSKHKIVKYVFSPSPSGNCSLTHSYSAQKIGSRLLFSHKTD